MIRRWMTLVVVCLSTMIPVTALAMASAELYTTQGYGYGRFEARVQHAPGDGVVSGYFLWKDGSEVAGAYWNEIDFEKTGADCRMQTNARYGTSAANHSEIDKMPGNSCAEYHDYRIDWTPSYVAWAVDGNEFRRDTGDTATAFSSQNVPAGLQIRFNIWPGDSSFGGNINNTTLPVHQYISWVQYSSYTDGNFQVQWREEFQNSGIPAGWAVGNWSSPYNLSTHSPDNVGFVDGIAVLSLTADDGTGQPGTPPPDDGTNATSGSGGNGGGSTGGSTGSGKGDSGGCSIAARSRNAGTPLLGILVLAGWLCVLRRGRRSRCSSSETR